MKKSKRTFLNVSCTILVGLVICQNQSAYAGWTGLINGLGVGWASVNVRSSTFQTNRVTTVNNLASPSAAMAPTTGYKTNAPLPGGASTNTYSRIKGLSGGIWQAAAKAAIGDGTDNAELQNRVTVMPADCASLTFDSIINQSQAEFNANGNSGTITVNAKATAGTALWLRGFEYAGSMADLPLDNPDTVENESIEYLKVHGVVKFETLVLGPFEFGGPNCPLIVPFTLTSSNLENLVFASDAVTLSLPLVIFCPPGIAVKCDESFSYPPVQYAGCGDIKITYAPAPLNGPFPAGTFPVGVTPVTATATDSDGHSVDCTFTVTVIDTTAPVVPALPILTGESSVAVPQPPAATDNCGGMVTATTADPLTYTNQGTFTVHWNFDDGHGNTNTANQTVIIDDVTAPVAPTIPDAIGGCGTPVTVTAPTAIDAVAGPIIGTTSSPLTYTAPGTNIIVWTFNDGHGNTSTATQRVIVNGPVFHGFYAPISGTGGTCSSPLRTATLGNNLPVKFDTTCGGLPFDFGRPTLSIERSAQPAQPCGTLTSIGGGDFTLVGNEWHFNWDTTGQVKATYKLTATLQDGTKQTVWIKLK
jgi:HYR domain